MAERIPLVVNVERIDRTIVLSPSGEISYHEAPLFRTFIRQAFDAKPAGIVVDMALVPYMSTPGVATLVEALQMSRRNGGSLVICGLTEKVSEILRISKLDKVFKIVASRAVALA